METAMNSPKVEIDFNALKEKINAARDAFKAADKALRVIKDNPVGKDTDGETVWLSGMWDYDDENGQPIVPHDVLNALDELQDAMGDGWSASSLYC